MLAAKPQPFITHVRELRTRLLWSVGAVLLGASVGFLLKEQILILIQRPLGQTLFYSSPTGGLDFLVKVCLLFGLVLALPVCVYNLLKFLEPAIAKRSKHMATKSLVASLILAAGGVAFAYLVSLPAALNFLTKFGLPGVESLISANEYLSFVMTYLVGFALIFQLPLLLLVINTVTPLSPRGLLKSGRLVVAGSFIVAAVLTPTPDPVNQSIMALPVVLLYLFSVLFIWLKNRAVKSVPEMSEPVLRKPQSRPDITRRKPQILDLRKRP